MRSVAKFIGCLLFGVLWVQSEEITREQNTDIGTAEHRTATPLSPGFPIIDDPTAPTLKIIPIQDYRYSIGGQPVYSISSCSVFRIYSQIDSGMVQFGGNCSDQPEDYGRIVDMFVLLAQIDDPRVYAILSANHVRVEKYGRVFFPKDQAK